MPSVIHKYDINDIKKISRFNKYNKFNIPNDMTLNILKIIHFPTMIIKIYLNVISNTKI